MHRAVGQSTFAFTIALAFPFFFPPEKNSSNRMLSDTQFTFHGILSTVHKRFEAYSPSSIYKTKKGEWSVNALRSTAMLAGGSL